MDDKARQDRADVGMNHEIGEIVEVRRLAIEDDQFGTVALGHQREAGRGPHHQ